MLLQRQAFAVQWEIVQNSIRLHMTFSSADSGVFTRWNLTCRENTFLFLLVVMLSLSAYRWHRARTFKVTI